MFIDKEVFSTCVEKYNCFNAAIRKGSAVLEPMNDIERYVSIVEKMQKTFISKNHDYGNSFATTWREFGDKGPITGVAQISHKYHRLLNLALGTKPQVDESIDDTLMDMANYCILTLMELQKDRANKNEKSNGMKSSR